MKLTWAFYIDSVEFTPAVIAGTASLGGSESACLGLMRALVARGHRVIAFTTKLHPEALPIDHAGVQWLSAHEIDGMSRVVDFDVFVSLRMPHVFALPVRAKYRMLWNQDLMIGEEPKNFTMALSWAYDEVAYVSEYHRKQWEGCLPELAPIGWATKNGYDPAYVPVDAVKNPNRIIHVTRPERGLRPILAMWPELKRRYPSAELHLCRYNSMYDASGWGRVCASYDDAVQAVNAKVGGITYLGELGKADLYKAIAESAVMWYPGVADFAETSCIAAIEAQACGTPFVGSWKGALPETVPNGILIQGDADRDEAYHEQSIEAVIDMLEGCKTQSFDYRMRQNGGRYHVQHGYTFAQLAEEWESHVIGKFDARLAAKGDQVLAQLLHEDDHVAAQVLATRLGKTDVADFCQYVIDGKDQTSDDYQERAMNPLEEIGSNERIPFIAEAFKDTKHVLDLACGNGAIAIGIAQANPNLRVTGIDYAKGNIDAATEAAKILGVSDRVRFICAPVYDFQKHEAHQDLLDIVPELAKVDGVFLGEFLEHIANVTGFLDTVHGLVGVGATVVCTMPSGPFVELRDRRMVLKRGHVHHFRPDDLRALFGAQDTPSTKYLEAGLTTRWNPVGTWMVTYTTNGQPMGQRPIEDRIRTIRPMNRMSVGIIAGETTDLRRCLSSIWAVADEIVIGDTGCDERDLMAVVAEFPNTRVIEIGPVHGLKGGFSEARNRTLDAATGDWFFWLDTDEVIVKAECLRRYLDGSTFHGYAIKQNHLMLDSPKMFDTPVRLFRRMPSIRFYGCIHEQPQMHDCNGDIAPALQLADVEIAHVLGYLTETIRRQKCLQRNLPLLARDQEVFPDRRLGKVLVIRDFLNLAQWEVDEAGGRMTDRARQRMHMAVAMFEKHFPDPTDKYHTLARPFYEAALKHVDGAFEVEFSFVAQMNGLKGRPKPERVWLRTQDDLKAFMAARVAAWTKPMTPTPVDVTPIDQAQPDATGVPV